MATSPDSDHSAHANQLSLDDPLIFLALRTLAREIESLQSRLPQEGQSPSPEQIHRMRITARRIRVALRLFGGLVPKDARRLRAELRWLGRALGEVRDLDVYAERIAAAEGAQPDSAAEALELELHGARTHARARLDDQLATPRFAALIADVADVADVVARKPSPATLRRSRSVTIRRAARDDVRASLRRVLKLGRKIDAESPPERLHRLRIRAKRLRYEAEFYVEFDAGLKPLARAAKHLQDVLGAYRDAGIAAERLRGYARAPGSSGAPHDDAMRPLIREQNRRAAGARRRFAAAWRKLERAAVRTKPAEKRKHKRK